MRQQRSFWSKILSCERFFAGPSMGSRLLSHARSSVALALACSLSTAHAAPVLAPSPSAPATTDEATLSLLLGLTHLSPKGFRGPPVILASGLFLAPTVFQHGPAGGLATLLQRRGFDVWTWNPWESNADSLAALTEVAVSTTGRVATITGKEPQWVGMEISALLGLRAVGRGAHIAGVVALGPRLTWPACSPPLTQALQLTADGQGTGLMPVVSSLWSWGDVPAQALDTALVEDMVPVSPKIASELLKLCSVPSEAAAEAPNWDKLWLPTLFVVSGRDGQAPIERVLEQYDQAPAEFKRLQILEKFPCPSHLGLLYGPQALKGVYRPMADWLHHPTPDAKPVLPLVGNPSQTRGKP